MTQRIKLIERKEEEEEELFSCIKYVLDVKKGKGDGLPEVVSVLAGDFEVLVELLLDERVVLHGNGVPHEIFLRAEKPSV